MIPSRSSRPALCLALLLGTALAALPPRPAFAEEAAGGVAFEPSGTPFADVLAKAKAEGKPVFMDFFTEW
jgi:hypothetical protein